MNLSNADIESILSDRLDALKAERATVKESLEYVIKKIETSIAMVGNTPREKEQELNQSIAKLERTHATTPQNSADERNFMREMDRLRQKKKQLATYTKIQSEIDQFKATRNELLQDIRDKDSKIDELFSGLKKIRLANRLQCNTSDILEHRIVAEESKISRIVGKGGASLKQIETECVVNIEIDRTGGGIRIMGSQESIDKGLAAIMEIVGTAVEEFNVSDESIFCLLTNKNKMVSDLMSSYGVRIDVSRAKSVCKIFGPADGVYRAKQEILGIDSARKVIKIDPTSLSFILGTTSLRPIAISS